MNQYDYYNQINMLQSLPHYYMAYPRMANAAYYGKKQGNFAVFSSQSNRKVLKPINFNALNATIAPSNILTQPRVVIPKKIKTNVTFEDKEPVLTHIIPDTGCIISVAENEVALKNENVTRSKENESASIIHESTEANFKSISSEQRNSVVIYESLDSNEDKSLQNLNPNSLYSKYNYGKFESIIQSEEKLFEIPIEPHLSQQNASIESNKNIKKPSLQQKNGSSNQFVIRKVEKQPKTIDHENTIESLTYKPFALCMKREEASFNCGSHLRRRVHKSGYYSLCF